MPLISIHALLAESDWGTMLHTAQFPVFQSTLSLRRATPGGYIAAITEVISIHALLAESDISSSSPSSRSMSISIHALLAESDFHSSNLESSSFNFNPRSPCGERRFYIPIHQARMIHFNPRSPCGERRARRVTMPRGILISIHALLAESDCPTGQHRPPLS